MKRFKLFFLFFLFLIYSISLVSASSYNDSAQAIDKVASMLPIMIVILIAVMMLFMITNVLNGLMNDNDDEQSGLTMNSTSNAFRSQPYNRTYEDITRDAERRRKLQQEKYNSIYNDIPYHLREYGKAIVDPITGYVRKRYENEFDTAEKIVDNVKHVLKHEDDVPTLNDELRLRKEPSDNKADSDDVRDELYNSERLI